MTSFDSRLITPPSEQEELYPYRRVWFSIALEMGILAAMVVVLFVVTRFVEIPVQSARVLNLITAVLPLGLWLIISWWRERYALRPRRHLLSVVVIAALLANAVSIPFAENVFQIDRWLPLENAINRIIGYTFTIGIVQALSIYLILRYVVWPDEFHIRLDGVAFGAACAVGYGTVFNLRAILDTPVSPFVAAADTFNQQVMLLCAGIIIGYVLAEVRFNTQPFPLLSALALALASLLTGFAIPLIAGFANTQILVEFPVGTVSPIQGFLFALGLLIFVAMVFSFLFDVAERQSTRRQTEDAESIGP